MKELQGLFIGSYFIVSELLIGGVMVLALLLLRSSTARYLGGLLIAYMLLVSSQYFDALVGYKELALMVLSISLYLYAYVFLTQRKRIRYHHLLPVLLGVGMLWLDDVFLTILSLFTICFYLISLFYLMNKEAQSRGFRWFQNSGGRLVWFRNFLTLNVVVLVLSSFGLSMLEIIGSGFLLAIMMIFYQVFRESEFFGPIPVNNKYQKSSLPPHIKVAILSKIESVMKEDEFYLKDDASLANLANELGVTTHHLSQVLNESMKVSFQELITKYRIRKACQLLKDKDHWQVKIENIATMVGYNSKSAFNTAFKRKTGLTPSEYRTKKDVRPYGEVHLSDRKGTFGRLPRFSLDHVFNLKIKSDMIQQFFKTFLRNLKRNSLFSIFNILGLTVGFTCSILIFMYIQDEESYDRKISDYDRIYRIVWMSDNPQTRTPHPMAQAMVSDFPEVEAAVSISPWYGPGLSKDKIRVKNIKTNVIFEEPDFFFADSTFLDVFKLEVIEGDKRALSKPWSLVISEPLAKKYFGDSSAIGQELYINDMPTEVSAVVAPMPVHSHFHFNAIIPYMTLKQINPESNWMTWADFGHFNYIRLKGGTNPEVLESKIPEWVLSYFDWSENDKEILLSGEQKFQLQPISTIHLNSHLRWELENNGNILYIHILWAILFFLMLIAAINYTNLTTAKGVERAKEVGVKKTLGAVSGSLTWQFYLEAITFSLIALCCSFFLVALLLGGFNELTDKHFQMDDLFNNHLVFVAILVGLGVGVIAGFYPAVVLSSFKPTEVLKGKLTASTKGVQLRRALVILQFTISAVLISASFIIFKQIQYMKDMDLGFDQEAIISLNVPISVAKGNVDIEALELTQEQLKSIKGIRATTLLSSIPGGQFNQHPYFLRDAPEQRVDASEIMVDYGFEEVLGIDLVNGRMFDKSFREDSLGGVIINETFARQLNMENPIGKTLVQDASGREFESKIIGVVKDFHFQSLHQEIQPLLLAVEPLATGHILIKLEGGQFNKIIDNVKEIYESNIESELPFEYHFLDQDLASLYDQEERTLSIFSIFSLIALFLASLGLLGMAIAILNQRVKELGIRKTLGATSGQIVKMILGEFIQLVLLAIILGVPIAYVLMDHWLSEFSYRVSLDAWPFVGAVILLLMVGILSVLSAVLKFTFMNPVDSLRYE